MRIADVDERVGAPAAKRAQLSACPWRRARDTRDLRATISVRTMPASVSKARRSPSPASSSQRAAQRMPLPHISASVPSALIVRMRTSAIDEASKTMQPSAPMPARRSQTQRAKEATSLSGATRASMTTKSLCAPCIFVTRITRASQTSRAFPVAARYALGREPACRRLAAKPRALPARVPPRRSLERAAQLPHRAPPAQVCPCLRIANRVRGHRVPADSLGLVEQSRFDHSARASRDARVDDLPRQVQKDELPRKPLRRKRSHRRIAKDRGRRGERDLERAHDSVGIVWSPERVRARDRGVRAMRAGTHRMERASRASRLRSCSSYCGASATPPVSARM